MNIELKKMEIDEDIRGKALCSLEIMARSAQRNC